MEIAFTECVAVTDASSVGEARRTAQLAAQRLELRRDPIRGSLRFLPPKLPAMSLVHGGGGQVIFVRRKRRRGSLARILAIDKGAGISNIADAMSDGYSTAGTMGGGMGAMKRMANKLEIFTGQNGTIVMIELGDAPSRRYC